MQRGDTWLSSAALLLLLVVFFSTPLIKFTDHIYSATDITQLYGLSRFEPNYIPKNGIFHDTVIQMQPWLLFNRESLSRGEIPLWNPYNANGVPHLGNYQSGVFSIYSLPFYMLPIRVALLLAPFLKLAGIGFFTFLFLREIGLRQLPAITGATAFMFSGYNVLWLTWPVVSAVITLPASLYFVERVLHRQRAESLARAVWPLAGLTVMLVIGLLSGGAETFYACFLLVVAYIAFRLCDLWRSAGYSRIVLRHVITVGLVLSCAGILAAMISGVQLLPFFEYVANSSRGGTDAWQQPLPFLWPLQFFPALLGNPASGRHQPIHLGNALFNTNFNEANGAYVGSFVLFLTLLAVLNIRSLGHTSRKYVLFFTATAVLWFIYATDVLNLKALFTVIPGVHLMLAHRTHSIPAFAAACCAAFCLDHVTQFDPKRRRAVPIMSLVLGIAFLAAGIAGAVQLHELATEHVGTIPPWITSEDAVEQLRAVAQHRAFVGWTFMLGLAAYCGAQWFSDTRLKQLCLALVLLVVFGQTGWLLKDYNPTSSDRFYYKETDDIGRLRGELQSRSVAVLGRDVWIANMNQPYKIPVLSSYDALGVRHHDALLWHTFGAYDVARHLEHFDEQALRLTGVDTVIVDNPAKYRGTLDPTKFQLASEAQGYAIYRYLSAVPAYRIVHHAVVANTDEEALALVTRPDFDPATSVVLDQSSSAAPFDLRASTGAQSRVELRSEGPTIITLMATIGQPGYLVLTKTFYPGWKAKVNGVPSPVLRANVAYSALALDAGSNRIELVYAPASFRIGALLSLVGLAAGLSVVTLTTRRDRTARALQA